MNLRRFGVSALVTPFGLYCIVWGIVASSSPTNQRFGAVFLGLFFLLLAFVYFRLIPRVEQQAEPKEVTP